MQRYNLFNQVHKALRAMLYDVALCLQQTDFTDDEESDVVTQKVVELVQLYNEHKQSKDAYVLQAIADYEPSVADAFRQEYVLDANLSHCLNAEVAELYQAASNDEKTTKGFELTLLFARFLAAAINQMDKEERVLNKLLWQYWCDEELKAIERKIARSIPAETQSLFTKWMLRGINKTETVQWLKTVEKGVSENVFKALFATAQKELPKRKFQQVLESLTDGVMLA